MKYLFVVFVLALTTQSYNQAARNSSRCHGLKPLSALLVYSRWAAGGLLGDRLCAIRPYSPTVPKAEQIFVAYLPEALKEGFRLAREGGAVQRPVTGITGRLAGQVPLAIARPPSKTSQLWAP